MQENKFDIFSISETELQNFDEKKPPCFRGYKTFFPKKREGSNTNRLLVFAREDIELSQRNDLMCPEISNVWLQLKSESQKVLLNFTYREFNDLTGKGRMSQTEQTERVNKLVDQFEKACSEGLVVALGDLNVDLNRTEDDTYYLKPVAEEYYAGVARCGLDILNFGIKLVW